MQERIPLKERVEDTHEGAKRLAKIIGLAAMATLLYGCQGKNPNEAMLQGLSSKQSSPDVESTRKECVKDVVKTTGLIECTDAMGVVTSLGD